MGSIAHSMYAGYNKVDVHGTRLGNWQEELALKEMTGYNRSPAPGSKDFTKAGSMATRTIEHTDRVEPANYKSTVHAHHKDPKEYTAFAIPNDEGARTASRRQAQFDQVEAEFSEMANTKALEAKMGDYRTVHIDSFARPPESLYTDALAGARAKKTAGAGGNAVTTSAADFGDHIGKPYHEGDAVTIYSESRLSGENRFPLTGAGHRQPFGRSSNFTNEIQDPTKSHAEALDFIDQQSHQRVKAFNQIIDEMSSGGKS